MNRSLPSAAALLAVATALLASACGEHVEADDLASSTANATAASCVSPAEARAAYDHDVQAAQDRIQASYADALAQHDRDVQAAQADRDAKLASLPHGDDTADLYNAVIDEYNAKVAPDGPIAQAYDARVTAARARWDEDVAAAKRRYDTGICH